MLYSAVYVNGHVHRLRHSVSLSQLRHMYNLYLPDGIVAGFPLFFEPRPAGSDSEACPEDDVIGSEKGVSGATCCFPSFLFGAILGFCYGFQM